MSRFVLAAAVLLAACNSRPGPTKSAAQVQHKLKVVTTLFPLFDMAKHVGAGHADVSLLLPPGVDAHTFEPRPSDVVTISEADIFVYAGKFMEPWVEDIIKGAARNNLIIVDASQGTNMIPGVFHDEDEPPGSLDPHIWLDFDNAKTMVTSIARALEARDSTNRNQYESRAADYRLQLTELDSLYRVTLAACKNHTVIYAGHYAFGYLARRYGLEYLAAQGVSPDAEPTAQDLTRLVDQIRKDSVKYVFYEELTSPKIAQTIAAETGAKMLLLNAAHNLTRDQFARGLTFFDILRQDLDNLKTGLEHP
jgi:zinc transport system substrate-binding protein